MSKGTCLILGALFILTSGLIYSIERLGSYVVWFAQINTGTYPETPDHSFFDNIFISLFIVIGIVFIVFAFKEKS
ncbi:hypothetical protein [Alkalibacillus haloalkaliphilus]|uniref:hypothetical protein n=1 Tax=Alkalibacillus haloalkaliphilus TaxID=94136 RepID=UPI0029359D4B|nr:hypothetical protein [Alkalibacillus haloalkaliphilus]MDV2582786.1 hypothetical protein [Alkalibacillus haloalkaliphilus]